MKKLLSLLLAGILAHSTAFAAITYQGVGSKIGDGELYSSYITVTANDTTTPINGKVIDNRDGRIDSISVIVNETASTGSSPTVNAILQGSNDGSNWVTLYSADATPVAVQTGATSVSSAATFGFDSCQEMRCSGGFPAFLKVQTATGGTGSPGWTGTVQVFVKKKTRNGVN